MKMSTVYRVFLIDDHPMLRRGLRQLLGLEDDFEVIGEASHGIEALNLCPVLQPDLIMLDDNMPCLSGIETLRRLRQSGYGGKVLIYSVSDADDCVRSALRHGANGYLLKDTEPLELLTQIRSAMRGKTVVSTPLDTTLNSLPAVAELPLAMDLTAREQEVLQLIADGNSNKMIGYHLGITEGTVKVHVKNVLQKLGLRSRVEAAIWVMNHIRK